ncbi:STIP1 homology and U-box containing protein 1 [Vigna unguiculata]|uniref:RING-type E3 ubiquitin transferase n=1 Tax=Vigna unguiculata TaxID=3917 RepID=A0A4D6KHH1_VIGUN|nr:STIP1 homology and U-box containing protein 1 [Vigna unguiculata]
MASEVDVPDHLKCPISLQIMSDPVILSSGHTFDRSSIQRWLDAGHRTCPITKLPLSQHSSLIPNHALRSLISNYAPINPLNHSHPHTLISTLTSLSSSPISKLDALRLLTRLSHADSLFRRRLSDSPALLPALLSCLHDASSPALRHRVLSLLLHLSLDDDTKVGLVAEGVLSRIVALLSAPSDCRAVAATLLTSLAVAATLLTSLAVLHVNKATIGAFPRAIHALVSLIREGRPRESKEAATALFALCSFPNNRSRAVECGAVPALLRSADSGLERSVEVIGVLAKCKEGREQMVRFGECVKILARVLRNGSSSGVQYALMALYSLCYHSEESVLESLKNGVLEICEGLLQDDNAKVKMNSSCLIQLLRQHPLAELR